MPDDGYESRTVTTLRTGSKIALLCGLPLLGLAVYFYFTPLMVQGQNGVFGCGSASNPPTSDWAKGVCQGVPDAAKYRAILVLALGLLIPGLGVALFGVDKRQERRAIRGDRDVRGSRDEDDDYDDYNDYDDAPRSGGARRGAVDVHAADSSDIDDAPTRRSRGRAQDDDQPTRRSGRRSYEDDDHGPVAYQPAPRVDR